MAESAHRLQYVVGQRRHVTFAVHLPQSAEPGAGPAQTIQGGEGPFRDGLAQATLSAVPLSGSLVDGMVHRKADVPLLVTRRETGVLNGAGLTIPLSRQVLVGAASSMKRFPAEDLALRTNQVVAVIGEVVSGYHAVFLPGVDRDVGRDLPFLQ